MLFSLEELSKKYNMKINGILHIGAHLMEELDVYNKMGIENILWIEGNAEIANNAKKLHPNQKIYTLLISDVDDKEVDFIITNNGQSSSILELDTHKIQHPEIIEIYRYKKRTKTIKTLYTEEKINSIEYNFLNVDVQGAELLVLKGMGDILNHYKYLYLEVNIQHLYENCPLIDEIDVYVAKFGFIRKETSITPFGWGDALYIKE